MPIIRRKKNARRREYTIRKDPDGTKVKVYPPYVPKSTGHRDSLLSTNWEATGVFTEVVDLYSAEQVDNAVHLLSVGADFVGVYEQLEQLIYTLEDMSDRFPEPNVKRADDPQSTGQLVGGSEVLASIKVKVRGATSLLVSCRNLLTNERTDT